MIGYSKDEEETSARPLIWIDSLCINQDDVAERNHQVALMSAIYSKAMTVTVWLGRSNENSHILAEFFRRIAPSTKDIGEFTRSFQGFVCSEPGKTAWYAFLDRPYWTRLWIVQELFLANRIVMFLGQDGLMLDHQIHWARFLLRLDSSHHSAERHVLHLLTFGSENFRNTHFEDLRDFLLYFGDQVCQDPRDKIYGLLGLTDGSSHWPKADYTISVEELYTEVVTRIVENMERTERDEILSQYNGVSKRLKEILGSDPTHPVVKGADTVALAVLDRRFPQSKRVSTHIR
jgi:hypothetical protein